MRYMGASIRVSRVPCVRTVDTLAILSANAV
jgi:hypothetical protein